MNKGEGSGKRRRLCRFQNYTRPTPRTAAAPDFPTSPRRAAAAGLSRHGA